MDDRTRLPGEASSIDTLESSRGEWGRFPPGTLFAGRFRIVAPLGRGGMGEVYRADDLKLGQTVALKLLPDHFARDPARLAQFHNEVRVARTITHRNVCRTYDIGDADGRPFLTMEYVDGEDLASLLKRIGRFPQEKALEVARQICAGLAAAHERGVLHRDLKPANVMIDGDGHVRITDFGLAAIAGSVDNIRSGTPAYMAPEQLAGREVTQRSDIYSLGLVLFELFTGKRVFEASSLRDLIALHESSAPATPSSLVRDLDPLVERAILRCLEREPAMRPSSPLAVAAALPGGDQLAAALAAGETPSPEMVAAAGEQSALRPAIGIGLVAFTIAMLAGLTLASDRFAALNRIPFPRSADFLGDRAQELIERIGYAEPPADTARGWTLDSEYLRDATRRNSPVPWPDLETGRTRTALFWYRTSPATLIPSRNNTRPTVDDPPLVTPGMRIIALDSHGRLVEFHAIPPQVDDDGVSAGDVEWAPLFDAAGLVRSAFHPVPSRWTPRGDADLRVAWEGPLPDVSGVTARVEAAASRGRPIFFSVLPPWTQAGRIAAVSPTAINRLLTGAAVLLALTLLAAATLLARRHLRSGRGDRRGAFRTAAVMAVCLGGGLLLGKEFYSTPAVEYEFLGVIASLTLYVAMTVWLFYVALEPYVRRFWPQLLIGWTRALSGTIRDPVVGRDVLVGVAAGTVGALLIASRELVPRAFGLPLSTPELPNPQILSGTRFALSAAILVGRRAIADSMQIVGIVVLLKILLRRTWLVLTIGSLALLPIAMSGTFAGQALALEVAISFTGIALVLTVLLRFGLLSLIITVYTFLAIEGFPLTTDLSKPYGAASLLLLAAIAALSVFGFYASRGSEPVFGRPLLD
ncbi:MAG TPA: serine/threonine-protein kinase [Vicinamibacterales bacterium]|nr:serine/threonine-protein kinase [Vicinamibacterales bacterium]